VLKVSATWHGRGGRRAGKGSCGVGAPKYKTRDRFNQGNCLVLRTWDDMQAGWRVLVGGYREVWEGGGGG
jgi:hypothetical protein